MSENLPRSDDLDATWNFIQPGIDQILGNDSTEVTNKKVQKILSPTMYMEIYTAIYNYCVNKSRSSGHFNADRQQSGSSGQSSILVGSEIYERLKKYLRHYISNFKKDSNETFLQFYVRRWKRYTIGAIFLNHAFDYMNRYWVQKERSDGKRHIFDVNTLCLMTWKEVLFDPHSDELITEILDQITAERNGEIIQRDHITTSIKSLVALGIDPQDLKKLNLNVYIQVFEKKFLKKTETYYQQYSEDYLTTHSVTEYIFKAHEIISREEKGMAMYWDDHTKKPLSETLNEVLVKSHIEKLESEFIVLLDSRDNSKISALYSLILRDFSLLPRLANVFEEYIRKSGENEVSQLISAHKAAVMEASADGNGTKKMAMATTQSLPPKDYIKALLKVYNTFKNIDRECFPTDPLFAKALDNACRAYININEFALPSGSSRSATSKTSEMLAKYSDQLLKKSTKPEVANDMSDDDIITIFKFITDKDAFESHYRRLFAKRLIHGTSTSSDDEESIIKRLQTENSMEYTGKITKMFQDVRLSKMLESDFDVMIKSQNDYSREKFPELQPFVLAENMWPFSYQEVDFRLPEELVASHKKLESMYIGKHNGRILKWLWPLCRGELKADIGKPGRVPFVFTVTLFQMSILLLFNDKDVLTFEEIQEGTNLNIQNIASSMVPFIKFKLVQQLPPGLDNLVKGDTQFKLNRPYKAVKTQINFAAGVKNDILGTISKSSNSVSNGVSGISDEKLSESEKIEKELNAERQMFLEACIVRIMKTKRNLPHSTLVNECIAQSHQRFKAKISMIKRAIDSLIQKGYLQRGEDGESYTYLA
ncbi:Cullin family profile [Nakaseomyces glabratus]|nr:Cullin family profile [Nakaseomyces glabratus]KAH7585449.1 Cullin family profile [Nakaseomyces glabratus]KTB11278.1 Cell division control protein 53 [Nakaseomyces glabratus]KTB20113.1 Cell division control protein 53 [Nakaseomyces glabratus]